MPRRPLSTTPSACSRGRECRSPMQSSPTRIPKTRRFQDHIIHRGRDRRHSSSRSRYQRTFHRQSTSGMGLPRSGTKSLPPWRCSTGERGGSSSTRNLSRSSNASRNCAIVFLSISWATAGRSTFKVACWGCSPSSVKLHA